MATYGREKILAEAIMLNDDLIYSNDYHSKWLTLAAQSASAAVVSLFPVQGAPSLDSILEPALAAKIRWYFCS